MADAVEGMNRAFGALSAGYADVPLRSRVQSNGTTLVMPVYLPESDALAVKIVSVFPANLEHGLPTIHALVLALDPQTGEPLAMMEGGSLTAIRTGAGSGAATKLLAREDAKTVAIIGSGVQAQTQLEAVCTVRAIERVLVYSRTQANAERFAEVMAGYDVVPDDIEVANSAAAAVREADIICAATTSATPVFVGEDVKPGTHINAVGSFTPEMQEVDETTIRRARVYVDSREAVMAEAGDLIIPVRAGRVPESHIYAEIGEVVLGKKTGREDNDQITYFKSVGVAAQDGVAAAIALTKAREQGIGVPLSL